MEKTYGFTPQLAFANIETHMKMWAEQTNAQNFVVGISGGKDSTILHYLLDMALPNNRIPRVFIDTGIEYTMIRDFVLGLAKNDDRFVIIKPTQNIKQMLEKYGYPFKSKQHSHNWELYNNNHNEVDKYVEFLENNKDPKLQTMMAKDIAATNIYTLGYKNGKGIANLDYTHKILEVK